MSEPKTRGLRADLVTVVVPAYSDVALVDRALVELGRQARDLGVVVRVIVSDDGSPMPLELRLPPPAGVDLEVVRSDVNGGPGAARNRALPRVATPWVVLLDADMTPAPGWLARAIEIAMADAHDGVEGRIVIEGEATPFTHATEFATAGTFHGGGNIAYRTAVLVAAGGFDERFYDPRRRLHFREDSELFYRLRRGGADIVFDDGLVAHHPPLAASFATPLRLARRYYFDPLLAACEPDGFSELIRSRRVGPVSLRRARHTAATAAVGGTIVAIAAIVSGRRPVARAGWTLAAAGYGATGVALSWRRRVRPRDLAPLAAVTAMVPWVYLWNYWRGVIAFGHRPRLR